MTYVFFVVFDLYYIVTILSPFSDLEKNHWFSVETYIYVIDLIELDSVKIQLTRNLFHQKIP